jgi:hypothetical protein
MHTSQKAEDAKMRTKIRKEQMGGKVYIVGVENFSTEAKT